MKAALKLIINLVAVIIYATLAIVGCINQERKVEPLPGQNETTTPLSTTSASSNINYNQPWVLKMDLTQTNFFYRDRLLTSLKKHMVFAVTHGAEALFIITKTQSDGLYAMEDIFTLIEKLNKAKVKTLLWVSDNAIGWDALLCLAVNKVAMKANGELGDTSPVQFSEQGIEDASKEVMDNLKAQVAALCRENYRPISICEAFVDNDMAFYDASTGFKKEKGKVLTLKAHDALRLGLIDVVAENEHEAIKAFGYDAFPLYSEKELGDQIKKINLLDENVYLKQETAKRVTGLVVFIVISVISLFVLVFIALYFLKRRLN